MKPIYILMCVALIFSCNKTDNKEDHTKDNFNNPIGYFKIKNDNGSYSLVPDEKIDSETFSKYFTEGGWRTVLECAVYPNGVDTTARMIGGGITYIATQSSGILRIYQISDASAEMRHLYYDIKYSFTNSILKSDDYYMVCHIDGNTMVLVRKENRDTTWTCCKFKHVDKANLNQLTSSFIKQ